MTEKTPEAQALKTKPEANTLDKKTPEAVKGSAPASTAGAGTSNTVNKTPEVEGELGLDMVDILVGPSKQKFRVHKALLCSRAPVFQKMFNWGFKEATDQAASLPDDLPEAFNLFLEWIYGSGLTPADVNDKTNGPTFNRIKLYCLGEKYCLPNLMDYTTSSIISNYKRSNVTPSAVEISYVYKKITPGSRLRSYIADWFHYIIRCFPNAEYWTATAVTDIMMCSKGLVEDVVTRMRAVGGKALGPPAYPNSLPKCTYHLHAKDTKCRFTGDWC